MLRWRLASAAVILSVLIGLLWLDYYYSGEAAGIWLVPLMLLLGSLAAAELLDMFRAEQLLPVRHAALGGTLLVISAACLPVLWPLFGSVYPPACPVGRQGWPLAALGLGVAWAFVAEMRRYKGPGGVTVNVALAVFTMTYVGLLGSFLVALRTFRDNASGMAALVSLVLVVKLSDSGAYFVGRALGRHKMAPVLSPGKTWEGAAGGIAAACLGSYLFFTFLLPRWIPQLAAPLWWGWLVYGVLLAVAGMVGDLAESLIKRDTGRKDSSRWLPGLGGVLDVIDSLLVSAPIAYMCWAAEIVGA